MMPIIGARSLSPKLVPVSLVVRDWPISFAKLSVSTEYWRTTLRPSVA